MRQQHIALRSTEQLEQDSPPIAPARPIRLVPGPFDELTGGSVLVKNLGTLVIAQMRARCLAPDSTFKGAGIPMKD
jgi:hypothetical protein